MPMKAYACPRCLTLSSDCEDGDGGLHTCTPTPMVQALEARVAELEAYRLNSAKFMSDVIAENDFYREQLRRIASETHTRLYMQDIASEALKR